MVYSLCHSVLSALRLLFSSLRRGILQCHIHDIYVYIFLTLISYYTPVINSMEMTDARVSSDFSSMSQNFTYEGQSASHRYPVVSPVHHTRPFLPCNMLVTADFSFPMAGMTVFQGTSQSSVRLGQPPKHYSNQSLLFIAFIHQVTPNYCLCKQ